MLTTTQLQEIKEKLENSQNPLFFFDNDVDGFCAFLILRKAIGRGRGVAIKSFPDLKKQYLRKVDELNPDLIVVLDKAEINEEFIIGIEERNLLLIWMDHHETKTPIELLKRVNYYSSHPSSEPTTYLAQKVFDNKSERWLAMIGCTGDVYTPEFAEEFEKEFPELFNSKIPAFDALLSTEIGKIARMLNFGLMDSITNVVNLIKYLFKSNGPYDLLEENKETKQFHKRYNELNKIYNKQVEKAEDKIDKSSNLIFFSYSGQISMSSQISNKLYYDNKNKLIVVAFKRPEKVTISIRGKRALKITKEAIKNIEGATGGGHEEATGAMIPIGDFEKFKKKIEELAF